MASIRCEGAKASSRRRLRPIRYLLRLGEWAGWSHAHGEISQARTKGDRGAGGMEACKASGEVMFMMEHGPRWQSRPGVVLPDVPEAEKPRRIRDAWQFLPPGNHRANGFDGAERDTRSPTPGTAPSGHLSRATTIGHQKVNLGTPSSAEFESMGTRIGLAEEPLRQRPHRRSVSRNACEINWLALVPVLGMSQMPLRRIGKAQPRLGTAWPGVGIPSKPLFAYATSATDVPPLAEVSGLRSNLL